jgi:hypothetical protein
MELLSLAEIRELSRPYDKKCGIYFLFVNEELVYVGQSTNIDVRVWPTKERTWIRVPDRWAWVPVERERLDDVERAYISLLKPAWNDDYITRKENGLAAYHGPKSPVETPDGVFESASVAARHAGITRHAAWRRAALQLRGWRWLGAPDIVKAPVGTKPRRVRTPSGEFESAKAAARALGVDVSTVYRSIWHGHGWSYVD